VVKMTIEGVLDWSKVLRGLVPDMRLLVSPAKTFTPFIAAVDSQCRSFWTNVIVHQQRDVIISAASTAVGINMTFLLPYSMLRKGWDKEFRGLAIFDLSTGLFIPFILATGCVVIASASQFHTVPTRGFLGEVNTQGQAIKPADNLVKPFNNLMEKRLTYEIGQAAFEKLSQPERTERINAMSPADKQMAAMLVKRDAFNLADSLAPLTGNVFSQYIFGIGVMGMAMGAITMLMLINGFVICEMLNLPPKGWAHRIGCLMVSVGVLGPFFWKDAKLWLAVPTSMFCMVLLPIAYFTFCLLINQKSLLGDNMPRGVRRFTWNVLMVIAASLAAFGSVWSLWAKLKWIGIGLIVVFVSLALIVHLVRATRPST